jgi:hypothetical protein
MGLPFLRPYWGGQTAGDFASGANFAVGGATALGPDFFRERGVPTDDGVVHLEMEMGWFRDLLDMLCAGDMDGMFESTNTFRLSAFGFRLAPPTFEASTMTFGTRSWQFSFSKH